MISWNAWAGFCFLCLTGLSMVKWIHFWEVFFFVIVWTNHIQGTTDNNKSRDGSQKRQTQVRHIVHFWSVLVPLTYCSWCESWVTCAVSKHMCLCLFSQLWLLRHVRSCIQIPGIHYGYSRTMPCQEECQRQSFQLFWKQHMFTFKWIMALGTVVYMLQDKWLGQVIDGSTKHGTLPQETVHF